MAPTGALSAPGSASYDSNTMTVGDGTWDFSKNTFLLPPLVGVNFETMRYNGMGNRFSSVHQYQTIITGHAVLATMVFLFLVPISIMYARFHPDRKTGRRIHAYLLVFALFLATASFILGFFAVGPRRALTNPHHGIGVALYVLFLVQLMHGSLIRHILKKSLRLMVHRWLGVITGLLGIIQIPLGLTLYGSPKFTFILYALWVGFLLFLYFVLSWRHENDWDDNVTMYGGRSHGGRSESGVEMSERQSERGFGWFGTLIAALGALFLLRSRSHYDEENQSASVSRGGRTSEVVSSRRASTSYYTEKYSDRTESRVGGWTALLRALGIGGVFTRLREHRDDRSYGEEYSVIAPGSPSRTRPSQRPPRKRQDDYTESEFTEDRTEDRTELDTRLTESQGPVTTTTGGYSSVTRPSTPRASHARPAPSSHMYSDYSSYVSPSRRTRDDESHGGGVNRGLLAAMGLGWFMNRMRSRRERRVDRVEDQRMRYEDVRREEVRRERRETRYNKDDEYGSPPPPRRRPPPGAPDTTIMSSETESSYIESRPPGTSTIGPPMPPLGAGRPHGGNVSMPAMPPDPRGVLHHESDAESNVSASERVHRRTERRQRDSEQAAAAAAASAAGLAAEESRYREQTTRVNQSVSVVKVKYHEERDRNVTLRRLTEDEARREQRRGRSTSVSSLSGTETPTARGYRRDGSARRTIEETEAEHRVEETLSPPTAAFVGGRRVGGKDSAYYSGQPGAAGPSGTAASPQQQGAVPTLSSNDNESHGTWSALSPTPSGAANRQPPSAGASAGASAAERRQRRRLERSREGKTGTGTGTEGQTTGTISYTGT